MCPQYRFVQDSPSFECLQAQKIKIASTLLITLNFANFTGKHLFRILLVDEVARCRPRTCFPGFHPSTFCYCRFLREIEFKMQLGVWGRCKLWLKQYSNLLKPPEMVLFFGCDTCYSYCVITSKSCPHILLNS